MNEVMKLLLNMCKVLEHYIWLTDIEQSLYIIVFHSLPCMQTYERSLDFSLRINVSLTVIDQDNK